MDVGDRISMRGIAEEFNGLENIVMKLRIMLVLCKLGLEDGYGLEMYYDGDVL